MESAYSHTDGGDMPRLSELAAPIAQGRTAEIFAWNHDQILKLYHAWCPPDWVEYEARVARAIVAGGIPTPAAGEVVEIGGRRGIVYERVQGVSMLRDMKTRPWRLLHHARSLAELHVAIHRLTLPGLPSYRDDLERIIRRTEYLPDSLRIEVLDLLRTLPDGQTLCHGDFHPDNILLTVRGPVVIDWMTAKSGSPWADVARTSIILSIGVRAARDIVSPLIRLLSRLYHRTYLHHYRTLSSSGGDELQGWTPVIAAARLAEQIGPERDALIDIVREGLTRV